VGNLGLGTITLFGFDVNNSEVLASAWFDLASALGCNMMEIFLQHLLLILVLLKHIAS